MDKKKWKKPLNAFLAATLATSGVAVVTMPYEAKAATDVAYVSATGDNSNNGETAATAFATLEAAYNALPATGGTIIITSDLEMTKEKALIVNDPNKTILVSESSRFGTSIANIVKNLSIEKYDTFESRKLVESFSPYFLVYKNEEGLLTAYRELIGELSNEEALFSQSTKKDAIVAVTHKNLTSTFKSYIKPKSTIKNTGSPIQQSYKFLVDLLAKEFDMSFKETKKIIDENLEFKLNLVK